MNREINREAEEKLGLLLKKEPSSLTPADIEYLKARSSYLNDAQRDMLKAFDTAKKEEIKVEADEAKAKADEESKAKKIK